jgi:hypothetical protein
MQPNDRITVLTRKNPYGEPLASRFQLLLDGKCRTVGEYCSMKMRCSKSRVSSTRETNLANQREA